MLLNCVRIGVAGAGVFGGYHAAKYASHTSSELVAIFDPDGARAQSLAEKYNATAFGDLDEFLQHVDAVIVTTPATVHFDVAGPALRAGRHVFIEKPITLEAAQADELIGSANAQDLVLQVGHQERYVFDAVGLLARGKVPNKIDCVRCGPPSGRCEDVSVVFDLMVHDIDLVRELTGADIQHVTADGTASEVSAEMVLENGAIVSMKASRQADRRERRMSLVYDDGIIEFDFVNRTLKNSTPAVLGEVFDLDNAPLALRDPLEFGAHAFLQAIQEGGKPLISGEAGRDAISWAVRIEEAAGILPNASRAPERMTA